MSRGNHGNHASGNQCGRWNDGKIKSSHGYTKIRVGRNHPLADPNGYAYEHLVVWMAAGREMPKKDEVLHHKNENKGDNQLDNLEIKKRYLHSVEHQSSLSDEQVRNIRELYASGKADMPTLAKMYGVPFQRISKYINGKVRMAAGGPILQNDKRFILGEQVNS